jgi:chaperonin GroEL
LESEALTALILNKLKWAVNVLAIKAPWFGEKKKDILKDIAILTWANLIADELGMKIENVTLSDLWYAANVIASQENTTIISWAWESSDIESRVSELKKQLETTTSKYDWEKLIQRIAKLAWWVAVIKVWAASETEMKERKLRIEDALNATRAAVEEGVVAWGWVALLRASVILQWISLWNADQDVWAEIVLRALSYPLKQIVENAWKEWSVVMSKILENDSINFWYNASDDTYVDMLEIWIVDPKKVARIALTEAISLAWMFLTTESAVWELPGKKDNSDMWAGWMWGWYPGMWMM